MPYWRAAAVALLSAVLLASCADPATDPAAAPPPEFPNWPTLLKDFRFRWSAEPGIDLLTGPTVPLRAFLESFRIAESTYDPNAVAAPKFQTYPGFLDAVAKPQGPDHSPHQISYAWPVPGPLYNLDPLFGNEYFHVLQLDPIDGGHRAYVCDGRYNIFRHDAQANKYISVLNPTTTNYYTMVVLWRVELRHNAPLPPPGPDQQGPHPAPLGDEFGNWTITATDTGTWGWENRPNPPDGAPDADAQHRRCLDRMPNPAAAMPTLATRRLDAPPPFEPPTPGWPANPT